MVRWNWSDKMGQMTIKQRERNFHIDIYAGNCLAIFLSRYKGEDGKPTHDMYMFLNDVQHARNIIKDKDCFGGRLLPDEVVSVSLNLYYPDANKLLKLMTENGYKVTCYYKEPKKAKKG